MCDQFGFSEACASSAAEETCGTCPLYPGGCDGYVRKDNPRPCGVSVSGGNDNPKGNLVLEAIDSAMLKPKRNKWYHQNGREEFCLVLEAIDSAMLKPKRNKWYHQNGREEFCPSYANEAIMKVKAIYLQHHPQGPEVAGHTTSYYVCSQCKTPIDMSGTGLDGLVTPSDGGEFERAIEQLYPDGDYHGAIHRITAAHNADRAADKQHIAELEAQLALALRQRDFESERSGKRMDEIVELREQLVAPGDDDPKGNSASNLKWWEIELARKEQRIAELEAQLAAAQKQRDCANASRDQRHDRRGW